MRLSQSLKGNSKVIERARKQWQDPIYIEKWLESRRSAEQRERFSAAQKERFKNPNARAKIRSSILNYWQNPENKAKRSGENAWGWRGGIAFEPYTPDFNDSLKDYIRARDNYTCQICGERENGRRFPCHHINYNKIESYASNLILLCNRCNCKVNFRRDYWKKILSTIALVRENEASISGLRGTTGGGFTCG
jgi:hypothetical protein